MAYAVKLHPKVQDFLNKLDRHVAQRIRKRLELLKNDPFNYLDHFEGDYYKFRIGDYRALIDVDKTRKIVFVRHLDTRGGSTREYEYQSISL